MVHAVVSQAISLRLGPRQGCHFGAAIGLRSMLEDFAPEIPDYALDMHTLKGKAMGRGLDLFRKEGAKLIPPPTGLMIPTRTKPIGCGRSNSRASKTGGNCFLRSGSSSRPSSCHGIVGNDGAPGVA